MRVPSADELAAIAAAYLVVSSSGERDPARAGDAASRWSLAGRVRLNDAPRARFAASAASRWTMAGRLDG
jgi:hypothetical protein